MLTKDHKIKSIVAKISAEEKRRACDFIQGAVYCFCKNNPDRYFAVRDLFGGENHCWLKTPLDVLYQWHKTNGSSDPNDMAGKDLGWLLLKVLSDDKRTFEIEEGYTHQYKWTGEEEEG